MNNWVFCHQDGYWKLEASSKQPIEIRILGDGAAPSSAHLQLLEQIFAELDELFERSTLMLDGFVDHQKFAQGNPWQLTRIHLIQPAEHQFSLCFMLESDYWGEWYVGFEDWKPPLVLRSFTRQSLD